MVQVSQRRGWSRARQWVHARATGARGTARGGTHAVERPGWPRDGGDGLARFRRDWTADRRRRHNDVEPGHRREVRAASGARARDGIADRAGLGQPDEHRPGRHVQRECHRPLRGQGGRRDLDHLATQRERRSDRPRRAQYRHRPDRRPPGHVADGRRRCRHTDDRRPDRGRPPRRRPARRRFYGHPDFHPGNPSEHADRLQLALREGERCRRGSPLAAVGQPAARVQPAQSRRSVHHGVEPRGPGPDHHGSEHGHRLDRDACGLERPQPDL